MDAQSTGLAARLGSQQETESLVYEVAVYEVADCVAADEERRKARQLMKERDGFISWTALTDPGDPRKRVDLLAWRDAESASAAAQAIMKDERFGGFIAAISNNVSFGHYQERP
jgi:hypothetical protein